MKEVGTGSCCRKAGGRGGLSVPGLWEGEVSSSCFEAARYPASLLRRKNFWEGAESLAERATVLALEVCCHLEVAAVSFARDNLAFFGRQGFEQVGEDTQPKVNQGKKKKKKKKTKKPDDGKPEDGKPEDRKPKDRKPEDSKPKDK